MHEERKPEKSGLRIGYAGIVQYLTQLISLVTGLVFVTLVTRNLSVSDFGVWQLIGSATGIALLPSTVITFWNLRDIARGLNVGRTSIVAGLLTLPLTFAIFFAVSSGVGSRIELVGLVIMAGLLQLPSMVLFESLKVTVQGSRPAILGYSVIPFELAKVVAAYYFVIALKTGVYGAILTLAVAYAAQDLVIIYGVRDKLSDKVNFKRIKEWIKASWVPLSDRAMSRIWSSDAIVVALVLAASEPVGFFQGARVFTAIIMYSEIFLRVLYPKLVRDRLSSDIAVAFRLQSLLEVPMVVGALVLAEDLLSVLGASYISSAPLLRLLAVVTLIESTEHVMYFVFYGAETVDSKEGEMSFKKLRSSWLVKLPLLDFTKSVLYIGVLAAAMYLFSSSSSSDIAIIWGIVYAGIIIPYTALKTILAKRFFPHKLPWKGLAIYILSGIVMGVFLMLIRGAPPSAERSVLQSISSIGYLVGLGALVYFGIVTLLDQYFRNIVKQVYKTLLR